MKIQITYYVCGVSFEAVAGTISTAYEYIQAIVKANQISFPNQEEALSEYMTILADMKNGAALAHKNHIFAIERI